jgi:hypothetical protein
VKEKLRDTLICRVDNRRTRWARVRKKWLLKAISMVKEMTTKKCVKPDMDKEIEEIRVEMERLTLKIQQEAQVHWKYEWPMKQRVKWSVQKLLDKEETSVEEVAEGS